MGQNAPSVLGGDTVSPLNCLTQQAVTCGSNNEILEALGIRAKRGDNRYTFRPLTVSGLKTTGDIAQEVGLSESSVQLLTSGTNYQKFHPPSVVTNLPRPQNFR